MKEISKKGIEKLIEKKFIFPSSDGYRNRRGDHIGFYRTKGGAGKRYIEDWYANKSQTL